MENTEIDCINVLLNEAATPEMIFGTIEGTSDERLFAVKKVYLRLTKLVHPDHFHEKADIEKATLAFKKLVSFWQMAQASIKNGSYGKKLNTSTFRPFIISTAKNQYNVEHFMRSGDMSNLYAASTELHGTRTRVVLKIPHLPEDNDLVSNEARILRHLQQGPEYAKLRYFVSTLLDDFQCEEYSTGIIRQIVVVAELKEFYSLQEIQDAYPSGVDVKDMAWMWRRILVALDFAHCNHVIHGAVLPVHIMVQPEQHGVVLIDWSYAVLHAEKTQEHIHAISSSYRAWYPAEVFAKRVATPGLDIAMAATCMIHVLGGSHEPFSLPKTVPWQIQQHLQGCTTPVVSQRPQQAHKVLQAFDEIIEQLWGAKTFHQFSMPKR